MNFAKGLRAEKHLQKREKSVRPKPLVNRGPRHCTKLPDDVKAAYKAMHMPAIVRLFEILKSDNEGYALRAAEVIIERNMGRVPQAIELSGGITVEAAPDLRRLSDDQLAQLKALTLAAVSDPAPKAPSSETVEGEAKVVLQ